MPSTGRGSPIALHALATLILAGSISVAHAVDASCCADLEQRIAELEAMAARKGNHRVKLEVSGLIDTAVMAWDDGAERNAYVVTNDNQRSRFSFVGTAAINALWEAGYALDLDLRTANSKLVNQIADGGFNGRLATRPDLRSSVWFLRNKRYGTGFIGTTFAATDRIANSNVTQTGMFDQ